MAHALYRSTFLENWGSGIHRIIEACREQGVEEPSWRWDGAFVYVTFKRQGKITSDAKKEQSVGNVAQNVAQNLDEQIIRIIKSNPCIKRDDIANQLSVNKKTIERHLKVLGIKWEGHPKTGHWDINIHKNILP